MKKLLLFLFGILAFAGMRAQGSDEWTEESLAQFDADLIEDYEDVVYMKSCIFPKGSGVVELPICIKSHKPFTTTDFNILLPNGLEPEYELEELGPNTSGEMQYEKKGTVVGTTRSDKGTLDFSYVNMTEKWNMIAFSFDRFPDAENNEFCSIKVNIESLAPGEYDLIVLEDQLIAGFSDAPNGSTQHAEQIITKLVISNEIVLDENSEEYPGSYTDVDVKVLRTISFGNWNTLCLPIAMTEEQCKAVFGANVEMAEFTRYEYDSDKKLINVRFNKITSITANRPLIIKITKDDFPELEAFTVFKLKNMNVTPSPKDKLAQRTIVSSDKNGRMIGNYVNGTLLADYDEDFEEYNSRYIFLSGNNFYYATYETKPMKGFRAYFYFKDQDNAMTAVGNGVKFNFTVDDDEPTSIDGISSVEKVAEGVYSLSGQKLSDESLKTLPKGVYIVNGKKVYKK